MPERREYKRFDITGSVIFKLEVDPAHIVQAELTNISFLGVGVLAPEAIEEGTKVQFELSTKFYSDTITGKGKIKHCGKVIKNNTKVFRIGMSFTQVDAKLLQHLLNRIHVVSFEEIRKKEQLHKKKPNAFSMDF